MFLSICSLYLPANAQLTRTQQVKRVAGISFLEVPDVVTSGNKAQIHSLYECYSGLFQPLDQSWQMSSYIFDKLV